jgi:hypothetical protein
MTEATIARTTDDLIFAMVNDLRPIPRSAMARRLAAGLAAGTLASAVLLIAGMGARPDLGAVFGAAGFWAKLAFALATAAVSVHAAARLGRPDARMNGLWLLPVPFLLYLPVGIWELAATPTSQWLPLLLGQGWRQCTWLVLLLSLPVYSGLWWAFRKFAPTHEQATGAVAGLSAAAVSAGIYCLHCPTDAAVFALVWYTLAFGAAALLGAIAGQKLLRW